MDGAWFRDRCVRASKKEGGGGRFIMIISDGRSSSLELKRGKGLAGCDGKGVGQKKQGTERKITS